MVPCFFLNPNWWEGIGLFFSTKGVRRSSIFSRILDRIGRRLIGLYDVMLSEFFPVLRSLWFVLHSTDRESIRFIVWRYIFVYCSEAFWESSWRTFPVFNNDFTHRAKGWFTFTTMANTGLAHPCHCLLSTPAYSLSQHIQHNKLKFTYNTAFLHQSATLCGISLLETQHSLSSVQSVATI
jgi:hypothetical protein